MSNRIMVDQKRGGLSVARRLPAAGQKKGMIFVISGPSGSGKTTIAGRILKDRLLRRKLAKSISATTRPRRSGERGERDYFFLKGSDFKGLLRRKKILEWTKYLGYYYGTPKDFVEEKRRRGRHLLMCLDLKGAFKIKSLYPREAVTVFVSPPSLEDLKERICKRCRKTLQKEVKDRLRLAGREVSFAGRYDYRLVNDDLRQVTRELKAIVLKKIKDWEGR